MDAVKSTPAFAEYVFDFFLRKKMDGHCKYLMEFVDLSAYYDKEVLNRI